MNKLEFNELEVTKQINYINKLLISGESLRSISNSLSISKTTIRSRFEKIGYSFDPTTRQYKKGTPIASELPKCKSNTSIFNSTEIENIREMLEWYSKQKKLTDSVSQRLELKIDSNKLVGEVKTTTVRLYSTVWQQFKRFMDGYREYKSMDLVSMALIEYMEKYSK